MMNQRNMMKESGNNIINIFKASAIQIREKKKEKKKSQYIGQKYFLCMCVNVQTKVK